MNTETQNAERSLEEYKYINSQIMSHQRLFVQVFTFSVIASIALLGYALQSFYHPDGTVSVFAPFVLIAPVGIILPALFVLSGIRQDIFRWGIYIRVFHEANAGYETRLNKLRNEQGALSESYTTFVSTFIILVLACTGLYIWSVIESQACDFWAVLSVVPIGLVVWGACRFVSIPSMKNREKLKKDWEGLK